MSQQAEQREKFALLFKCTGCGRMGSAVWEEDARPGQTPERNLLRVSTGFRRGGGDTPSGLPPIVCRCDTVMVDWMNA